MARRNDDGTISKVVNIRRVSKKTKGGNRLGFTCLAVVGDGKGAVGKAHCYAPDVYSAIQKTTAKASRQMVSVPLVGDHRTIPHRVEIKDGPAHVLLKPAPEGTGLRLGGAMRAVAEAAGIKNITGKNLGTRNRRNTVDATMKALKSLKDETQRKVKSK